MARSTFSRRRIARGTVERPGQQVGQARGRVLERAALALDLREIAVMHNRLMEREDRMPRGRDDNLIGIRQHGTPPCSADVGALGPARKKTPTMREYAGWGHLSHDLIARLERFDISQL